ncbi:MAG: SPOR domain-containing protein [Bacteroidota bacterium]
MKIFVLIILSGITLGLSADPTDPIGGKNRQGADVYFRYEQESVKEFREYYDFQRPDNLNISQPTAPAVGTGTAPKLDSYFKNGQLVFIDADPALGQMIEKHKLINERTKTAQGYKIQVYMGASRSGATAAQAKALRLYSHLKTRITHSNPTYRVRMGNFLRKEEADLFVREVRGFFRQALVVPSVVEIPKNMPGDQYYYDRN